MERDLMELVEDLKKTGMIRNRKGPILKRVGLENHFDEPLGKECIGWAREYLTLWVSEHSVTTCQRLAIKAIDNTTNEELSVGRKEQVIDVFCCIFNKLYPFRK
ncbi:MAG: hypothetical protein WC297_03070 [Candidatus Paceibacterota bacterium]|jgi:hypothetical protein